MEKSGESALPTRPATVITGASTGIGRELALTAQGELVLVARSRDGLEALAGEIAGKGGVAHVLARDLSQPGNAQVLADFLKEKGLHCDVLVNNAGFGLIGRAASLEAREQLNMIDLNVRALTELTLAFLPGMLARGRGGVLNVGSVAGFLPGPNMAVYYATKAFVRSFSSALWEECRGKGVAISNLCPGPVATGFFARATGDASGPGGAGKTPKLFRMMPALTSRDVAKAGWSGFHAGKRTIIPGWTNKVAAVLGRLVPTRLLLGVVARAQKSRVEKV